MPSMYANEYRPTSLLDLFKKEIYSIFWIDVKFSLTERCYHYLDWEPVYDYLGLRLEIANIGVRREPKQRFITAV